MKYIYILALLILIIICCCFLKMKEGFFIPTAVLRQLDTNSDAELLVPEEDGGKPPDNISSNTVMHAISGISKPTSGSANYEPREDNFEKESDRCDAVKFCENLTESHNCGYCLQDDLEGKHPFHYGNEKGPFGKRDGRAESLCKAGVNRDGKKEWVSPSSLNGQKQKQLEAELKFIRTKFPRKDDPRRTIAESSIMKKIANMGIEDTGYSGCMKMRERYICSKVNDCSPMNFTMFGMKAKDICGFCADDGKAYARIDLPPYSKSFKKIKYVMNPKCENIDIFGDGVNCKAYHKNKSECLSKRSLVDPSIPACAYNLNSKRKVITVGVPVPSDIKYGKTDKTKIYDKCESEWGLIRPTQCDWFKSAYPCLESIRGGPHSNKCLQSLWNQLGFQTNYRVLLSDSEGKSLVDSWHTMDADSVTASMEGLYKKIFSYNYDSAKKWAQLCYGLDVNVCNRAGFITDEYPSKYWSETSNPCMSLLYRYGGGKPGGLANPEKGHKMGWGRWFGKYEGFTSKNQIKKEEGDLHASYWRGRRKWRKNETDVERYAGDLPNGGLTKIANRLPHRAYVNKIRKLNRMKDMPDWKAKRVNNVYRRGDGVYSNAKWVDKFIASKMITGETPDYPTSMPKPCWPDFARKVLIHPYVELIDLETLSFRSSYEFFKLSHIVGKWWDKWQPKEFENMRRKGERFYTSKKVNGVYNMRIIKKETYDQPTFPYWEWIRVSKDYWRKKWYKFSRKATDYDGVKLDTYQNIVRPTNVNVARQIAKAFSRSLGGSGYNFSGNYGVKGLYTYRTGRFKGRSYFGYGGSNQQKKTKLSWNKGRLDAGYNYEVLVFEPHSRFYNTLPTTTNIRKTLNKPHFFEYINEKGIKVRVLFAPAWVQSGFPYYDFLKVMSDLK